MQVEIQIYAPRGASKSHLARALREFFAKYQHPAQMEVNCVSGTTRMPGCTTEREFRIMLAPGRETGTNSYEIPVSREDAKPPKSRPAITRDGALFRAVVTLRDDAAATSNLETRSRLYEAASRLEDIRLETTTSQALEKLLHTIKELREEVAPVANTSDLSAHFMGHQKDAAIYFYGAQAIRAQMQNPYVLGEKPDAEKTAQDRIDAHPRLVRFKEDMARRFLTLTNALIALHAASDPAGRQSSRVHARHTAEAIDKAIAAL
jgi:hypothetical protein